MRVEFIDSATLITGVVAWGRDDLDGFARNHPGRQILVVNEYTASNNGAILIECYSAHRQYGVFVTTGMVDPTEGVTISIGYDVPWRQVEAMLIEAACSTKGVNQEPPPFVLQTSLSDFAVDYQVNANCSNVSNLLKIYSELHANIQDAFNEYGGQIMSPAYVADPESAEIVSPEHWHAEPASPPKGR